MAEQLTEQQRLTLDMLWRKYDAKERTREHLDGKAATILQAGGLVVVLTGAVSISTFVTPSPTGWTLAGLAFAFALFLGMILCALLAWRPSDHSLVGPTEWDELYNEYINETIDKCYAHVVSNLLGATERNGVLNDRKAHLVGLAGWLFAAQVTGILALAVAAALL
jgi:hypothetical protein